MEYQQKKKQTQDRYARYASPYSTSTIHITRLTQDDKKLDVYASPRDVEMVGNVLVRMYQDEGMVSTPHEVFQLFGSGSERGEDHPCLRYGCIFDEPPMKEHGFERWLLYGYAFLCSDQAPVWFAAVFSKEKSLPLHLSDRHWNMRFFAPIKREFLD